MPQGRRSSGMLCLVDALLQGRYAGDAIPRERRASGMLCW